MTWLVSLMIASAAFTATPIILDTDLGDDIDDTWALCQALAMPELDIRLIVTASDDTPTKTRLVAKMLEAAGRTDIPLATGLKTSDRELHQLKWLGDYQLSDYKGKHLEDGVQAIIDTIQAHDGTMTLCVIGPQTNIGAAVERAPEIAKKARIVSMAGSVYVGYDGNPTPQPEWNVMRDVPAIQKVFAAPWEIILAPLDICGTLRLTDARYRAVKTSENPLARIVIENYEAWTNRAQYGEESSSILFDTVAVYLCGQNTLAEMETIPLKVDEKGATLVDKDDGRPVEVAVRWRDREAFEEMLVKLLTQTQ